MTIVKAHATSVVTIDVVGDAPVDGFPLPCFAKQVFVLVVNVGDKAMNLHVEVLDLLLCPYHLEMLIKKEASPGLRPVDTRDILTRLVE